MEEAAYIVVLITTANAGEARQVARVLLEQRKAACVNITEKVDSHFWWEGKIDSGQESLLVVKSKASLLPEIIELVKKVHSYDVPEIIALPVVGGNQDYLQWIDASVSQTTHE
ncbi:divalent-cation tolerance protein CutA [Chloroflexota bacterium]